MEKRASINLPCGKEVFVGGTGLSAAVKLVAKTFLETRHYQDLHKYLSDEWSHCHSLTAAMRLMEAHGVHVSPVEEEKLAALPEDRMIDALVMRMPEQSREQFEHFFLQLSLIASTTTRLRAALEAGDEVAVEEVMDQAENVGILPFILKMSVAQAGNEVKSHLKDHEGWLCSAGDRMGPMLQAQANAMISRKAMADAKAQLELHHVTANEKTKAMLMGLVGNSMEALRATVFASWCDIVQTMKKENEIRKEYAEEIEAAEKQLQDYILKQTSIMKNMINRSHGNGQKDLIAACFQAFVEERQIKYDNLMKDEEMKALEDKMKNFSKEQSAKSKKVLSRLSAGSDQGLLTMCLVAWVQHMEEYKKNKDFEDAVKEEEKRIAEFMSKHSENSKGVLSRMSAATDSGLTQTCFQGWVEVYTEIKKANEMEDMLMNANGKFTSFGARNKKSAKGAMDRAAEAQDQNTAIVIFWYWKRETRVERMRRWARDKNTKKKQQLIGVKGLFKNFANELEAGLKEGTPRIEAGSPQPKKKSSRQAEEGYGPA